MNEGADEMISVAVYAERHGLAEEQIVRDIRDGSMQGRLINREWYVNDGESQEGSTATETVPAQLVAAVSGSSVSIVSVNMSIADMTRLMVKAAIAAIPALIILAGIFSILMVFVANFNR